MPSPPVKLHQLLLSWQLGDPLAALAFALQVLAVLWYGGAVLRLRRRGVRWSPARSTSFVAGVVVLCVAVVSGVASYDDRVFVVHIFQHLLLMMVAPPLLALGAPVTLAIQAARRPLQGRIVRLLHRRVVRFLATPLFSGLLYYASMYAILLTPYYRYSLQHELVHDASHVVMLLIGCLFWWPMIGIDPLPNRPTLAMRLIWIFAGMPFEVFLGVAIMNFSRPIAPEHTVADTHAGGAVFWVASMLVTLAAAVVILAQWMPQEERETLRQARAGSREGTAAARPARQRDFWAAAWSAKAGSPPVTATGAAARDPDP
ncbi:MAG: cytochrome c oxidase assembly protein [Acidimicrobiales bacterium]|nr:cytochrome c oxidase assembly protein [Acidimicrobiales bacterium]